MNRARKTDSFCQGKSTDDRQGGTRLLGASPMDQARTEEIPLDRRTEETLDISDGDYDGNNNATEWAGSGGSPATDGRAEEGELLLPLFLMHMGKAAQKRLADGQSASQYWQQ